MARLLSWPRGLGILTWQPLAGPRTEGASSSESITGKIQTVASAFGAWVYQLGISSARGRRARLYRGLVIGLNGGANAVRVPFNDPNIMSFKEAGINCSNDEARSGVPWSNSMPWSNGCNWKLSRPTVAVGADAAKASTLVTLADEHWGRGLLGGEWIGFFPFHFGKYVVTQVLGDGVYRVWPPLRVALTSGTSRATLNPVMAMRPKGESAATANQNRGAMESNTMTLVEVPDDIVRSNFAD